jgi:hypothetical protein
MGRDSSVGIATRYGLDGPGIASRWGRGFSASVQTGPGAHPASYTTGTGSFPGVKRQGRGVDHPPPSSAEVKQRVQPYLYSPSGPSWPVIGWTLPFISLLIIDKTHKLTHTELSFAVYAVTRPLALSDDCVRSNWDYMGRECSTYGGEERFMQGFGGETWGKEITWKIRA